MLITLIPQRRDDALILHRQGDALIINGVSYDFGPLPEGATLPRSAVTCEWLVSNVSRSDGVLHLTLLLPHGPDAPRATLFPEPIRVSVDGEISIGATQGAKE